MNHKGLREVWLTELGVISNRFLELDVIIRTLWRPMEWCGFEDVYHWYDFASIVGDEFHVVVQEAQKTS